MMGPYRVYVHDTDVAGVVHHSHYLRYFEAGRIEYLRSLGCPYIDLQRAGIGLVPVHVSIRYHRPLRQDDTYFVDTKATQLKRASCYLEQSIVCNNQVMVSATIHLACVREPAFKPCALPPAIYEALSQ